MQPNSEVEVRPVTQEQIAALRNCVNRKIEEFNGKGRRNKYSAAIVKVLIVAASVATPILIGWKGVDGKTVEQLVNWALITSAIASGATTLYNFFDYKDLWAQYKVARNELASILAELDYLKESGLKNINVTQQQMEILFKKYIQVCTDTNSFYRETRLAKDDEGTKK
ncbi:DUF4231 domain-containing protein [Hymenobacter sp. UV11]|uniref:SLATT domain-containing protein n=1 Tax=Hymenobacter sp. UV11 TaxID=1849735 RepID=UPI00105D630F|nr:DUF4231 domain-containing protein [Hymenobacter sp. UV11]TDN39266.1 hypothetical protein A8B98_18580 [Hymenobacter sp. UV11]TFZ65653.1 DUF4231 domain-containing protein [Hymenobacter sp. UV11]